MKTTNGQHHYTVADLIKALETYNQESLVYATFHKDDGFWCERPFIGDTAVSPDKTEVYLYLDEERERVRKP